MYIKERISFPCIFLLFFFWFSVLVVISKIQFEDKTFVSWWMRKMDCTVFIEKSVICPLLPLSYSAWIIRSLMVFVCYTVSVYQAVPSLPSRLQLVWSNLEDSIEMVSVSPAFLSTGTRVCMTNPSRASAAGCERLGRLVEDGRAPRLYPVVCHFFPTHIHTEAK